MASLLDKVFKYKMNQRVAFRDSLTEKILFGDIQNRRLENKKRIYTVKTDILITVNESDILGFFRERKFW